LSLEPTAPDNPQRFISDRYHPAWFYTCAVSHVLLNDFQVSANHCAALHTVFSASPAKTILPLVDTRIPARFALAALSDDRGENGAQLLSKTDISWAAGRSAIDALQSLDN
jgi:hypothetical protein